jgi:CheY-like chemotaxis protein
MWLIAEDDTDIRNLMETLFTVWGYDTLVFDSGTQVWDWLDAIETGSYGGPLPEFAVLDIRMPGKKGNELARRMRELGPTQMMPIVLMTAFALSTDEQDNIIRHGVDKIISKPLPDFDKLYHILHEVLYKKAQ